MSKAALYWIVGVLSALFIAGLTVIILGGAAEEAPPAVLSMTTAAGDLHLSSQMAASWVREGEHTEFWLQVENTGKADITDVTLLPFEAPGFALDGCDCQSPGASCPASPSGAPTSASAALPCSSLASKLAPGQKITVWIHLRAERVHPSEILSAGVGWKDAAKQQSSVAASVGPISIRSPLDQWIQARVGLLQGLALPLTTFLLGGIFSVAKYYSDRADKLADEQREHKAHIADERREQLTQTWNQMLPASHKLALGYYVPMSAAVHEALYWLAKADPANVPAPAVPATGTGVGTAAAVTPAPQWDDNKRKRGFYGLMLFEARVRHTTVRVGGFYFKDRTGEKIVSRCYLRYRDTFYRQDSAEQEAVEKVRDLITVDMSLKDFNAAWTANQAVVDDAWNKFKAWTVKPDGYPKAALLLTAFRAVLEFESNRPYEYWYGRRDRLYVEKEAEKMLREKWPGFTDSAEADAFQAAVIRYLDTNEKEVPAENEALP